VPFPPTNIRSTFQNSTSVTIEWDASPNALQYKYTLDTPENIEVLNYIPTSISFTSLEPSSVYTIHVYAGVNDLYETFGKK